MEKNEPIPTIFNLLSVQAFLPDDGGLVLRIKATKPKDFVLKQQVRVRLSGDDMWKVLSEVVGKQLVAGFKLAAHPMSLSGEMFKSRDIRPNDTRIFTDIVIGATGNYRVSQHLLTKRMRAIVQKGDPDFAFEFEYGEYKMMKWRQEGLLFAINTKLSHILRSSEMKTTFFDKEAPLLPIKPVKEPSPTAKRRKKDVETSSDKTKSIPSRGEPEVHSGDESALTSPKAEVEFSNRRSINSSDGKGTKTHETRSSKEMRRGDEQKSEQEEKGNRGSILDTFLRNRSLLKEAQKAPKTVPLESDTTDERIERLTEKPVWDFQQWSSNTNSKLRSRLDQVKAKLTDRLTKEFGLAQPSETTEKPALKTSETSAREHNFYKAQESTFMRRNKVAPYENNQYEPLREEYNLMMEMGNYPIFSYFSQPPSITGDMLSRNVI